MIAPDEKKAEVQERLEASFFNLDIFSEVERHTSTRLHPARSGKQATGACPYPDCSGDHDGFIVFPVLSDRGKHYTCRTCKRSGHILNLVMDITGMRFSPACAALGIPNPYRDPDQDQDQARPRTAPVKRAPESSAWSKEELAYLDSLYPRMQAALVASSRAQAYLAERGIPLATAQALGLGYIPALSDMSKVTPELKKFSKWCDRLIFPLQTPGGARGYIGRALALWHPGMDEYEHKRLLEAQNINRWEKTYPAGFFNWQITADQDQAVLVLVEGLFDALALVAADICNVVALAGTAIDVKVVRPLYQVERVIIGMDGDGPGAATAKKLAKDLKRNGLDVTVCAPVSGKDWSEAYRLQGVAGLAPVIEALRQDQADLVPEREQSPATTAPGVTACEESPENSQAELANYASCHQAQSSTADILASAPDTCGDCGASVEDDSRDFFYEATSDTTALLYCAICRDMETGEKRIMTEESRVDQVSYTQFMHTVEKIAALFDGCAVNVDAPGYTIQDRARELAAEKAEREQRGDYWQYVRARVESPPHGVTREDWTEKLAELRAWRPSDEMYAHLGGYEAYCRMHRKAAPEASELKAS